ncbi:MAG: CHAT domain-containing protein [Promethearchaeota archaeon]
MARDEELYRISIGGAPFRYAYREQYTLVDGTVIELDIELFVTAANGAKVTRLVVQDRNDPLRRLCRDIRWLLEVELSQYNYAKAFRPKTKEIQFDTRRYTEIIKQQTRTGVYGLDIVDVRVRLVLPPELKKRWEEDIARYGDVSFQNYTVIKQVEALRVAITVEPTGEEAVRLDLEPPPDETQPIIVNACVVVSPHDFEIESPNVQTIDVPLDADSAPVIFKLIPKSVGRKTIAVEFFQHARYLGRAALETTVSEGVQDSHLVSAQVALGLGSWQIPPDLTVLFDRVPVGEGRHYYRYRLLSYKRELNLWFDEFHTPETNVTPQGFLEETFAHLNQMYSDTTGSEALFFERLNSIGTNLYGRLFPDDLKALYWEKLRDNVRSIVIISYEPWIPWELVRPFHPETKQAEDGFLCEKFDLTRWLSGAAPPDVISLERLGLIVATSGLESAESEAAEIRQLFGDKAEDISPSGEAVYQLLKTGGFSGLHFACHGEYNAKEPDWSNLLLTEGATLCPIDVDGDKLVFGKDRPFVFLNACETGQGGYALTGMGGWAEAFVRRANGSGFVGSIWEAHDESAYKFAVAFYRHLLAGKTVAEAVRLARQGIKRAGDPTWLSYTVYANPLARLVS